VCLDGGGLAERGLCGRASGQRRPLNRTRRTVVDGVGGHQEGQQPRRGALDASKGHVVQPVPGAVDDGEALGGHQLGVLARHAARAVGGEDHAGEHLPQPQLLHGALANEARAGAALLVALAEVPHRQAERQLAGRAAAAAAAVALAVVVAAARRAAAVLPHVASVSRWVALVFPSIALLNAATEPVASGMAFASRHQGRYSELRGRIIDYMISMRLVVCSGWTVRQ
jgi:hypothetical protein